MRDWLSVFLIILISGCAQLDTKIIDMAAQPTEQQFDLTDSDGDGVILARDLCEQSVAGAKVANNGCSAKRTTIVRHKLSLNFAPNSYQVGLEFLPEIKALAEFMKEYSDVSVTIEGHTSKRGKKAFNQALSENRAQAVKDLLVNQFAIAGERIEAVGYGSDKLLIKGNDEYIHSRNRRIVAEISSERPINDMKWTIYSVDQPEQ